MSPPGSMTLTEQSARMPPLDNAGPAAPRFRWPAPMQLPSVPLLRKKWRDSALSCSREIDVARRGLRKKAWWPCGPALEKFDSVIAPDIEALLKHVDLGDADLYLRLYMIGKSPSKSRPVIMVCCSNSQVRTQAEEAIRASEIPELYPEFALGACALPLEQPGLIRALAGMADKAPAAGRKARPSHHGKREGTLQEDEEPRAGVTPRNSNPGAAHSTQLVGRRIYARVGGFGDSGPLQPATGGAVIRLGDNLYQLTVSHAIDAAPVSESWGSDDLHACHFDGMSEEEEDDDEDEGLMSWEPEIVTSSHASPSSADAAGSPDIVHSWDFKHDSRDGSNPGLDYALLDLNPELLDLPDCDVEDHLSTYPNKIDMRGVVRNTTNIWGVARIPTDEQEIVVATASRGVTRGVLLPTAVYFRNTTLPSFQKLYPVLLQDCVSLGDSGSVVVGSGKLFGHLVRGVPGSTTAYIVAATEVFADIRRRTGLDVTLAWGLDLLMVQEAVRGRRRGEASASEDTVPGPEERRYMAAGMNGLHPVPTPKHPYLPTRSGFSYYPLIAPVPARTWDGDREGLRPEIANTSNMETIVHYRRSTSGSESHDDSDYSRSITTRTTRSTVPSEEDVMGATALGSSNTAIEHQDGAEINIIHVPRAANAEIRTARRDKRSSYIAPEDGRTSVNIEDDGQPHAPNTASSAASNQAMELDSFYKRPGPVRTLSSRVPTRSFQSRPGATASHAYDYGFQPSTSPPRPAFPSPQNHPVDGGPRPRWRPPGAR